MLSVRWLRVIGKFYRVPFCLVLVWSLLARGAESPPAKTAPESKTVPESKVVPERKVASRRLGTNEVVPSRILTFFAPLNPYARAQVPRLGTNATVARGAIVLPEGWNSGRPIPILVVCSPSGSPAIPQLHGYTNAALTEGWAVLAADGPRVDADRDTVLWNWGTVGSVLEYFQKTVPEARSWPVAVGGFSGGAKRAACVAAAFAEARRPLWGVFMGGCNEDRATTGALLFSAGPGFRQTPMFLSNGNADPIAGPMDGANVRATMEKSGFTRIRAEIYEGAHRLSGQQVREALRWFQAQSLVPRRP